MSNINLPGGYSFDPVTGEIAGNGIPRPTRSGGSSRTSTRTNTSYRRTYSSSSRGYGLSLWDRINNFFIDIGNWIAFHGETAMSYLSMILFGLSWLLFAIAIISVWINDGFFLALISGIIGGTIFYFISGLALAVFYFIDDFILLIVRYIFYNVYTFIAVVVIISAILFVNDIGNGLFSQDREPDAVEHVYDNAANTNMYYCTASTALNVRTAPNTYSHVLGALKPGQEVHVQEFVNGFAKISYNGYTAYVSSSYLEKK